MNASEDQTEPMGESPELTMPRVVSLLDRQTQALNEIRTYATYWSPNVSAVILAILERNGIK